MGWVWVEVADAAHLTGWFSNTLDPAGPGSGPKIQSGSMGRVQNLDPTRPNGNTSQDSRLAGPTWKNRWPSYIILYNAIFLDLENAYLNVNVCILDVSFDYFPETLLHDLFISFVDLCNNWLVKVFGLYSHGHHTHD